MPNILAIIRFLCCFLTSQEPKIGAKVVDGESESILIIALLPLPRLANCNALRERLTGYRVHLLDSAAPSDDMVIIDEEEGTPLPTDEL
jgi:hypothetical protein